MAKARKSRDVTWAQATRDVIIRLIATGQLPVGIFGACVILLVYKTPDQDIPQVWATLQLFIKAHAGLGYLLNLPILCAWYLHTKFQRRTAETELKRISPERTKEQQKFFSGKLDSSKE
jgi:hypothetical protein